MSNPKVAEILQSIQAIHDKKSADYAQDSNVFSNFERAAILGSWFNDPVDKVFAILIGIKLTRLAELLNGKSPKNESIADSFLDENTYSVIWHSWYLNKVDKTARQVINNLHEEISANKHLWRDGKCTKCGVSTTDVMVNGVWCNENLLKSNDPFQSARGSKCTYCNTSMATGELTKLRHGAVVHLSCQSLTKKINKE